MMPLPWALAAMCVGAAASLIFSTLTYSLRELSRARLTDYLQRHHRAHLIDPIVEHQADLVFVTAVWRLLANTLIALATVWVCQQLIRDMLVRDLTIFFVAATITLVISVALPQALTKYAGDKIVGASAGMLMGVRTATKPVNWIMHLSDEFVRSAAGISKAPQPEQIEQQVEEEILSAVEEGEERGVVDEQEREMIESVIEFHDSAVAQIMTSRGDMVALPIDVQFDQVTRTIQESGHSRIPVFEQTLDQIVGILYARDLLAQCGQPAEKFDVRPLLRPAFFVPETRPLGDLLHDFRGRKAHIAIVLDEYGGTAGLVTLEDILELLVGDISDEQEKPDSSIFVRIDHNTIEADARIEIGEFNRLSGLHLPEDEGYSTLGGYVLATFGQIPEKGAVIERDGVKFIVLDAEPQRINRVRLQTATQIAEPAQSAKL
jgi:CBS domain containing-hemolysin-like protein